MKRSPAAQAAHEALAAAAKGPRQSKAIAFARQLVREDYLTVRASLQSAYSKALSSRDASVAAERVGRLYGQMVLQNPQVLLALDGTHLAHVPPDAVTPELAAMAVRQDGAALEHVPAALRSAGLCAAAIIRGRNNQDYRDRDLWLLVPEPALYDAHALVDAAVEAALAQA